MRVFVLFDSDSPVAICYQSVYYAFSDFFYRLYCENYCSSRKYSLLTIRLDEKQVKKFISNPHFITVEDVKHRPVFTVRCDYFRRLSRYIKNNHYYIKIN